MKSNLPGIKRGVDTYTYTPTPNPDPKGSGPSRGTRGSNPDLIDPNPPEDPEMPSVGTGPTSKIYVKITIILCFCVFWNAPNIKYDTTMMDRMIW